jgi:outer membrane protein assembly factor BamB
MPAPTNRPYRRLLPIWVWIFLAIAAGFVLWVRVLADIGDHGLTNVSTMATILALLIVLVPWFLFFSRFRRRTRLWVAAGAGAVLALFFTWFRFEGVSGEIVPLLGLRGAGTLLPGTPTTSAGGVDLRSTTADDFPGFLGLDRSQTLPDVRLTDDWGSRPPELIWKQPIGAGWSAFAIVNGVAVTMEQRGEVEMVTAYKLMTGRLLWSHGEPGRFSHPMGGPGPRSTPLIADGLVYALTPHGVLLCLEGSDGSVVWRRDLLADFGVTPQQEVFNVGYGRANSPLVVRDLLVIPAGGNPDRPPASLAAYNKRTGEKVWEGGDHQISFSSPRLATLGGIEQILILNENTASGYDPATGRKLWEYPWPGRTAADATSSQAVPVPPDRVFISRGYGEGAALLRLAPRDDGTIAVHELWHNRAVLRTKFTNVVILDDHVYGLSDGILECVALATGERVWKDGRYHHGQILLAGRMLIVQTEDGEIVLVAASPERPNDVRGRIQALNGPSWNNIALYGPYLAIRNAKEAAVYRLPLAEGGPSS